MPSRPVGAPERPPVEQDRSPTAEAPSIVAEATTAISDDETSEDDDGPSEEELADYLGVRETLMDEEGTEQSSDRPLPELAEVESRIPAKTKALMDELFRAKLQKVQRIDPKKIH